MHLFFFSLLFPPFLICSQANVINCEYYLKNQFVIFTHVSWLRTFRGPWTSLLVKKNRWILKSDDFFSEEFLKSDDFYLTWAVINNSIARVVTLHFTRKNKSWHTHAHTRTHTRVSITLSFVRWHTHTFRRTHTCNRTHTHTPSHTDTRRHTHTRHHTHVVT